MHVSAAQNLHSGKSLAVLAPVLSATMTKCDEDEMGAEGDEGGLNDDGDEGIDTTVDVTEPTSQEEE